MKTSDRAGKLYDYPLHAMGTAVSGLYVPEKDIASTDDFAHIQSMRVGVTLFVPDHRCPRLCPGA